MKLHRVTILGKPGCHLCEVAKETVNRVVGAHTTILVEEVDILQNPDLHAKYKDDIPVILVDGVEKFRHEVDAQKLAKMFDDEFGQKLIGF